MPDSSRKIQYTINGMHCASCEVMIERSFKKVPGVEKVSVNHATGKATVTCSRVPDIRELQHSIKDKEYTVVPAEQQPSMSQPALNKNTKKDYKEIGIVVFVIAAAYIILRQYRLVPEIGVSDSMSLGFVFVIGLVAAMSTCIAVTGGLLVAVAAKYNASHPGLSGMQKLKPNLYFNAGRVISYTVLGGVVGALGSAFTLSPKTMGLVTIIASLVMVILGFQLLKLFPWMRHFQPKMPKFLAHRIHDASGNQSKAAPFLLGGSTFFLPCGFTQALQLYVLSKGDWKVGALTMLFFALGTLPALLSLSAMASFAKGGFQRYFLKFSGVIVIALGVFNINNGLALTGSFASILPRPGGTAKNTAQAAGSDTSSAQIVGGKQVINMTVDGYSYDPATFIVMQGIPVEWRVDGAGAAGCGRVIIAEDLGVQSYLQSSGTTTIEFTPQQTGTFRFNCPMGMMTRGSAITVVPNDGSIRLSTKRPASSSAVPCNPEIQRCADQPASTQGAATPSAEAQKFSLEVSRENGISPNDFTVKNGIPVELAIDDKVQLGGCMGTWIYPSANAVYKVPLGVSVMKFTPIQTGTSFITCSMGSKLIRLTVTD